MGRYDHSYIHTYIGINTDRNEMIVIDMNRWMCIHAKELR